MSVISGRVPIYCLYFFLIVGHIFLFLYMTCNFFFLDASHCKYFVLYFPDFVVEICFVNQLWISLIISRLVFLRGGGSALLWHIQKRRLYFRASLTQPLRRDPSSMFLERCRTQIPLPTQEIVWFNTPLVVLCLTEQAFTLSYIAQYSAMVLMGDIYSLPTTYTLTFFPHINLFSRTLSCSFGCFSLCQLESSPQFLSLPCYA